MDHRHQPERQDDPHAVDPVAMLLRATRDEPDARRRDRVRANVHAAWHEGLAQRQNRWRYPILAMAAAVTFAVLAAWLLLGRADVRPDAPSATKAVATVTRVEGQVLNLGAAGNAVAHRMQVGDTVTAEDRIRTGHGRLGLKLEDGLLVENGVEVRLDAQTEMRIAAVDAIELTRGAVYVDTDGASPSSKAHALAIVTPLGTARDIGTRFAVRLEDQALHLAVRDGQVEVEQASSRHLAASGTALVLDQDGETTRTPIAPYDAIWAWTAKLAPGFELDGASLAEFLAWLAYESGWTVEYGTQNLAVEASSWHLSGPRIQGLALEEALAMAMRINALDFELEDGTVTVLAGSESRDAVPDASAKASSKNRAENKTGDASG